MHEPLFSLIGLVLFGIVGTVNAVRERKRRAGWNALAEKYWLENDLGADITPAPAIKTLFFKPVLANGMQGQIHGVPVVVFDICVGLPQSSGVGIQRTGLALPAMHRLLVQEKDGWTYLYGERYLSYRPMNAAQIERLLTALIHAAGEAMIPPNPYGEDTPGGVVIRPVKLR